MTLTFKVGTQMLRATRCLNMVVISVKLFQNLTSNNEVMGRTQMVCTDGRTDGRTDGQGDDYMLPRNFSGSIKTEVLKKTYFSNSLNVLNNCFAAIDCFPGCQYC